MLRNKQYSFCLIIGFLVLFFIQGCIAPKSYCYLDTNKMEVYLTDSNKIKNILIYNIEDSTAFSLDKIDTSSFLLDLDTLLDRNISITVRTTDFRQHYLLRLESNETKKKEVIKFKALRR